MRILLGIQATGFGHTTRAKAIIPHLEQFGDVEILMSGYNEKLKIGDMRVHRKRGIGFTYDKYGGISLIESLKKLRINRFISDVTSITIDDYDLIISDFEPVTAWAARRAGRNCIGLSHQAAFLSPKTPRPGQRSLSAELILRYYAPVSNPTGFHFLRYDNWIEPPVIRNEVMELNPVVSEHITVYLPAYSPIILSDLFSKIPGVSWEVFSPACEYPVVNRNVTVRPLSFEHFLKSLESCQAVICGAGFETCAEALYLDKKLLVIPVRNQYEQRCNAAALERMGVTCLEEIGEKTLSVLRRWIRSDTSQIKLTDICDVNKLVTRVVMNHRFGDTVRQQLSMAV